MVAEIEENPQSQKRLVKLANTGRTHFKVGNNANPGGRPKGLALLVRDKTKDGKELVAIMLDIAHGKLVIEKTYYDKDGEAHVSEDSPAHRDRIAAIEWLADRGFGKSATLVELSGRDGGKIEIEHCSADDLRSELLKIGAIDVGGRLVIGN